MVGAAFIIFTVHNCSNTSTTKLTPFPSHMCVDGGRTMHSIVYSPEDTEDTLGKCQWIITIVRRAQLIEPRGELDRTIRGTLFWFCVQPNVNGANCQFGDVHKMANSH